MKRNIITNNVLDTLLKITERYFHENIYQLKLYYTVNISVNYFRIMFFLSFGNLHWSN